MSIRNIELFEENIKHDLEVFRNNTGYVTDPEECMADYFGYAILYGMKGNDGEGYPDPEIIRGIIDYLKQ